MVPIYIIYMVPFYICYYVELANLLAFWFQSTEKEIFTCCHQGGCSTVHRTRWSNTLYYRTSYGPQVRQRLFGVTLTLYQPVDENSNVAPLRDAMTSHEKTSSLSVSVTRSSFAVALLLPLANYATCRVSVVASHQDESRLIEDAIQPDWHQRLAKLFVPPISLRTLRRHRGHVGHAG